MADFTSFFWSGFITVMTLGGIAFCFALIRFTGQGENDPQEGEEIPTMGHVWDENLEEYNNPLPRWWLYMFYITLVFGLVYLWMFPGLGTYGGMLGWTSTKAYQLEMKDADAQYGPIFAKYASTPIAELGSDAKASKMGERLFVTYCAQCHGSDAGGARGFPNLRDKDWLWGGTPETIKTTIMEGRTGAMPSWQPALGDQGVDEVANYVLSLSGRKVDAAKAEAGKAKFAMCAGCHMPDGTGNPILGAPNLTDNTWLYGGSIKTVKKSIAEGRAGRMPAQKDFLGNDKVHLLAGYVYSLSNK